MKRRAFLKIIGAGAVWGGLGFPLVQMLRATPPIIISFAPVTLEQIYAIEASGEFLRWASTNQ